MNEVEGRLGRALLLRFDAGQPLTALSPAWAALCGLFVSGAVHLDARTLVLSVLLLLLVEPMMGGLWELVVNTNGVTSGQDGMAAANETHPLWTFPYMRAGSAGHRLATAAAHLFRGWRQRGWDTVACVVTFVFALTLGSVLGQALLGVVAAVLVLAARLRWQAGMAARLSQTVYDLLLPWLMGMVALGQIAEQGARFYRWGFVLTALYALAYLACLTLADDSDTRALWVLDGAQLAVLALLLSRQQTLAVWIYGLCLVGQMAAHPDLIAGGRGAAFVRRSAPYIVVGMLVAAIALAPTLTGQ
jgi:hypothetical protein